MPMSLRRAAFAATLVVCAASAQPQGRDVAVGPTGEYVIAVPHDGRTRTALVRVPDRAAGETKPIPVVLNFHGGGGNARTHRDYVRMDALAEREGFIVVYPNGTGRLDDKLLTWNAGLCCGYAMNEKVDDVGFVRALIDALATRAPIDTARVYATGLSNGAMLSYRLAAQLSDRIAAIAPVAGSMVLLERRVDDVSPALAVPGKRAVPILHIHSIDDKRALYFGGLGEPSTFTTVSTKHPNAEEVLYRWVSFEECTPKPVVRAERRGPRGTPSAAHTATLYVFGGCRDGGEIALWKLTGAGHVWPGGRIDYLPRILGPGTDVIDANEEMWKFFKRFALPPARS
ncbi:MAG TPA: PHB depolymerase family esterase [Burkholderiales bacterium]|nr:PHB depolymerase family esterase [Burkholderiales bacterium]